MFIRAFSDFKNKCCMLDLVSGTADNTIVNDVIRMDLSSRQLSLYSIYSSKVSMRRTTPGLAVFFLCEGNATPNHFDASKSTE